MEGSTLTRRQTQQLYDTGTLTPQDTSTPIRADDVAETQNHFALFDLMINHYREPLSHEMIKNMHRMLKSHTSQDRNTRMWNVGEYKRHPNQIGLFDPATPTTPITPIRRWT
jgi:Fic family protein